MALGYREVFQIYDTLSKSTELQKGIYKMSIKDIAKLYQYWKLLKLVKMLQDKCEQFFQNIVQVNRDGLFVNLEKLKQAEQRFKNIGEDIILEYQYSTSKKDVLTVQKNQILY
nr:nuclease domain-containing protein [Rummeliibacillus pycnus]